MSARIPFVEPEEAEGAVQDVYRGVKQNFGMVPNLIKVLGNSPESLTSIATLIGAMEDFDINPIYAELAYLKTSSVNDCDYWRTHHRSSGLEAGLTDEQIDQLAAYENSDAYEDTERNVLRFADQLTREADVSDEVVESLKSELSSKNLVELAVTVSVANMTNRINHAFDVPLEEG